MIDFNKQSLEHLKKLCRIHLSKEEEEEILQSLKMILAYVDQLNEIDTEGALPCSFVLKGMSKNPLREDLPKDLMPREQFLANAPDQIAGMIRVPPVLKVL